MEEDKEPSEMVLLLLKQRVKTAVTIGSSRWRIRFYKKLNMTCITRSDIYDWWAHCWQGRIIHVVQDTCCFPIHVDLTNQKLHREKKLETFVNKYNKIGQWNEFRNPRAKFYKASCVNSRLRCTDGSTDSWLQFWVLLRWKFMHSKVKLCTLVIQLHFVLALNSKSAQL